MLIIPAIDLKDGCVVRYVQGRLQKKVYSRDPVKTARHWARQGAKLIHVVDLDGAFTGVPVNLSLVKAIAEESGAEVQFGGGVRKIETIQALIGYGVSRVVLGTKAIRDPDFLKKVLKKFGEKIIVSVDAREGRVMAEGWQGKGGGMEAVAFALKMKEAGLGELIYTDIAKDGTLTGPNIKGIKALLKETGMKIIASGGVSSLDDIYRLKMLEKQGLAGVIVGKALYEGRFTLTQALKLN
jgi:phosphoribosylformimino-5-aminoimidazole carboxamide ribotide isomerase